MMNSNPFWLVLAAGIVSGIILFIELVTNYSYGKKRRKEGLRRMALEIGFAYYPGLDSVPIDSRPDRPSFPLEYSGTKGIRSAVLQGKITGADVLVFDYRFPPSRDDDRWITQTVVCFRIDPKSIRERFPDRMLFGRAQVEGWFVEFGARGWLCVYKSGCRVKPGEIRSFLAEAKRIAVPSPDTELPAVRWLGPHENPFGAQILDCRPVTLGLVSCTTDLSVALRFNELRASSGDEFRGMQPKESRSIRCNLAYPHKGQPKEGPLFKAAMMEDKWDIYIYDGYLYFSRSWSGELIFRAKIGFGEQTAQVETIETGSKDEDGFVVCQVDYLIKSHVNGLEVPHPLPTNLGQDPQKLAVYSFQLYGRRGLYGSFADTLALS